MVLRFFSDILFRLSDGISVMTIELGLLHYTDNLSSLHNPCPTLPQLPPFTTVPFLPRLLLTQPLLVLGLLIRSPNSCVHSTDTAP